MIVLLVIIQVFYCTNTLEYTNIPSCRGEFFFDSSRLQEEIFVYTCVKMYNKANLTRHYIDILTLYVLMDSSYGLHAINMESSIVCVEGSRVIISKIYCSVYLDK